MSQSGVTRIAGLAFGALVALPASAADLGYPYPGPEAGPSRVYREERIEEELPARAEPLDGPRFAAGPRFAPPPPPGEECRTIVKRRIGFDGEEIERRVRICDEAPYPRPRPRFRPEFDGPVPPGEVPDERW